VFKANGTYYIVVKDGSKIVVPPPVQPHPEPKQEPDYVPEPDPDSNNWKLIGLGVIGAFVALVVWMNSGATKNPVPEPVIEDTAVVEIPETFEKEQNSTQETIPQIEAKPSPVEQEPAVVQPKETDEQIFNRALKDGDWATMRKLGNKGYMAACGALARHYVTSTATSENHKQAYNWALRASDADKKYVMDILEKYGFLVNGKPVVE